MKTVLALVSACVPLQVAAEAPVGKVLTMLSDLEAKIVKEGETSQKEYAEFAEWCEDRARNIGFEIKTGETEIMGLKANIGEETATIEGLTSKVDELTGDIASAEGDLKAATKIRKSEAADFAAEEAELSETIDMLTRASGIIEKQMNGGASMMQLQNAGSLMQAVTVLVQASLISSADKSKLSAFMQQSEQMSDDDEAPGAPASSVYDSHSGDILSTLQDLLDKAEAQLGDLREREVTNKHNFEMLVQSLKDEISVANKDLSEAKTGIAAASEKKSTAGGDLSVTVKSVAEATKAKADLHHNCMTRSETFAAETKSRAEELKALAQAKKVLSEATGASFGQVSFVQISRSMKLSSGADLAKLEVVRFVRDLAHKQQSSALMQLASRMDAAVHSSSPFEKVKNLIVDMISKLEEEAGADATKKAYCDKELAETSEKKADKTGEIKKLSTRIDQMSARSAQLKEEVAALENALSKLAKSQAEMDQLRQEEKTNFGAAKAELEKGLTGIKLALKILTEYYASDGKAHQAAEGAGNGIISLLEVVEADFSKNLAQATSDEELAVAQYEQDTKDNEIDRTDKEQSVVYKVKESKELDKFSSELSSDRSGVQAELDAVLEYKSKIEQECIAKAETFEARKARFQSEISGLKEALQILESETALVQRKSRRVLRGGKIA